MCFFFLVLRYALPWTERNRTTRTQLALCVCLKWIRNAFTLTDCAVVFFTWCSLKNTKNPFLHWNKYPLLLCSLCLICLTCTIIFFTVKCTTTQRNKNIHTLNLLLTWKVYLKMGDGYYLWASCVENHHNTNNDDDDVRSNAYTPSVSKHLFIFERINRRLCSALNSAIIIQFHFTLDAKSNGTQN